MLEDVLTVEQVAQLLGLHPKTVRGFITSGRLKARKIGKGWRIMKRDFQSFIEGREKDDSQVSVAGEKSRDHQTGGENPAAQFRVSTVIDAFVSGKDDADRLSASILAAASSKDPVYGDVRVDYIYYESESKARFVLYGSAAFIGELLIMLSKIT